MSPVRRFLTLFTVAALLVWVTLTIAAYDQLPATLATHFGPGGTADGFAERSIASWFTITIVGALSSIMVLVLAQLAITNPTLFNVPGKAELLALPPGTQAPFLEQMAVWMTMLGASMVLLFAAIQYDMWNVSRTAQRGLSVVTWVTIALALGGNLIATPIWLWRFRQQVKTASVATSAIAGVRRSS